MRKSGRMDRPLANRPTGRWMDFDLDDPKHTALLVIDMQNYGCHPGMGIGKLLVEREGPNNYWFSRQDEIVVPNIQKLLRFFRANNLWVMYSRNGPLLPDASDMYPRRIRKYRERGAITGVDHLLQVGTPEHAIIDELKPMPGEMIFDKNSTSVFASTNLDQILRNRRIQYLVITGMATNACVETTARYAADIGYDCVLMDDACVTGDKVSHDGTMRNFASLFGRVGNTKDVIAELQRAVATV